jgi:putative ABC transport system permease protein
MTFRDTLGLAFRNLGQAKLRTSLTTMGVSIGIASLAGMVSLGVGLQDQFVSRFTKAGLFDSITVTSQQGFALGGGGGGRGRVRPFGGRERPENEGPAVELNDEVLAQIAAIPHVRDVYPNIVVPVEIKYAGKSEFFIASGIPQSLRDQGAFQSIVHGQFFQDASDAGCMMSLEFAKRFDEKSPGSLVGQQLTLTYAVPAAPGAPSAAPTIPGVPAVPIQRVPWICTVRGIAERETGGIMGGGVSSLMIPLQKAKEIRELGNAAQGMLRNAAPTRAYQSIVVKTDRSQYTQDVEAEIKKLGLGAFSLNDALQNAKRGFLILDIVLSLVGSIALAVSSLGIVNTMVMSILERTREIGIMKAIGGSDGDIRRIFLIEASAIGVIGGIAGVVLGWTVGRIINFGANIYITREGGTAGNLFSLPLWLIGGAIGFSIALSLVAGSYPASRAAKLDPIQALRHD